MKHDEAVREVAKQVYSKWFHDTVYCLQVNAIAHRLTKLWKTFREGRRRLNEGRDEGKIAEEYKVIASKADKLFDVGISTIQQQEKCSADWGVKMSEAEHKYYEDQKTERKMECDKGVDPVWYCSMMRRERMRERQEQYRVERDQQFLFKDLNSITEILSKEGVVMSASDISVDVTPSKVSE